MAEIGAKQPSRRYECDAYKHQRSSHTVRVAKFSRFQNSGRNIKRIFASTTTTEQLVLTEKTNQTNDVCAAIGHRYGAVLPAEDHLVRPLEAGGRCAHLEAADGRAAAAGCTLYGTRQGVEGNKVARLEAIRDARQSA